MHIKEPVNAWTHFVTFIAAVACTPLLIVLARKSVAGMLVVAVYGLSMVALFGASTLYHWLITTPRRQLILRRLDHGSINFLIAGSATPLFYYGLHGTWRVVMLATVWGLALLSGVFQVLFIRAPRWLQTGLYLLLGWTAIIPFPQLMRSLPRAATILVMAAGLSYTVGAVIYATKKMNFLPGRFGFHEVFHLFVSTGTAVHFAAVVLCIRFLG
jgi:hemolysin III